ATALNARCTQYRLSAQGYVGLHEFHKLQRTGVDTRLVLSIRLGSKRHPYFAFLVPKRSSYQLVPNDAFHAEMEFFVRGEVDLAECRCIGWGINHAESLVAQSWRGRQRIPEMGDIGIPAGVILIFDPTGLLK